MTESTSANPKLKELHSYLVQHFNIDTEYWYGGHSAVIHILTGFKENDFKELVSELKNWETKHLSNLANALTADDDRGSTAIRSYIFGQIFLILDDGYLFDVMDNFDYLENSDYMLVPILADIKRKLDEFDFLNYDKVALKNYSYLVDKLSAS